MILDKRGIHQQWAEKILDLIPDDIVFEKESTEGIIAVLKEFEESVKRVARNEFIDEMYPEPTEAGKIKRDKYIELLRKNNSI